MARFQFTLRKLLIAMAVFAAGLAALVQGVPQVAAPRNVLQDTMGWYIAALGMALVAAAACILLARRSVVVATLVIAALSALAVPVAFVWFTLSYG